MMISYIYGLPRLVHIQDPKLALIGVTINEQVTWILGRTGGWRLSYRLGAMRLIPT
jgi:hypothetical protein